MCAAKVVFLNTWYVYLIHTDQGSTGLSVKATVASVLLTAKHWCEATGEPECESNAEVGSVP